jgi:hypothetical protein
MTVTVGELESTALEKSRKAFARVLQSMQSTGKAAAAATVLGVSDSTVSRVKNEKLEDSIKLIYLMGFKLVESDWEGVDSAELSILKANTIRLYQYEQEHGALGDEEE